MITFVFHIWNIADGYYDERVYAESRAEAWALVLAKLNLKRLEKIELVNSYPTTNES